MLDNPTVQKRRYEAALYSNAQRYDPALSNLRKKGLLYSGKEWLSRKTQG